MENVLSKAIVLMIQKNKVSQGTNDLFTIEFIVDGSQSSQVSEFMKYSDKQQYELSIKEMTIWDMMVWKKKIAQGTDNEIKLVFIAEAGEVANIYRIMEAPDDQCYTLTIRPQANLFDQTPVYPQAEITDNDEMKLDEGGEAEKETGVDVTVKSGDKSVTLTAEDMKKLSSTIKKTKRMSTNA